MVSTLEYKANKLAQIMQPNKEIDPILLLALIRLLTEIIKVSKGCFSSKEMLEAGRNPGILTKVVLRNLIRLNLNSSQYTSCNDMINNLIELTKITNEDEVKNMEIEVSKL